ncbi:MAG: Gfo/Idh/MocA family oxidoreductase [Candidatus Omnitrophota bacterium]
MIRIRKILFIGLGGAGQRHLRIFKDLLPADVEFLAFRSTGKTPLLNPDFSVDNSCSLENKYGLRLCGSLREGLDNNPDLAVIANPTVLHFDTAIKAAGRGINIFIEKPLACSLAGANSLSRLVLSKNLYFFVSFQLRFNPQLRLVKEMLLEGRLGKIISAEFNVCSYVPGWHKYEDFKNLYACRKDLGGGVLLTEIHEIDLACWYFGLPDYVYCVAGNYSGVPLEVEDTAHTILKYKDFSVQVNQSFMQKHPRRDLYISGTKGYLEWSSLDNKLLFEDYSGKKKRIITGGKFNYEGMFYSQARFFLKKAKRADKNSIKSAYASVAVVEAAKKSSQTGRECKVSRVI